MFIYISQIIVSLSANSCNNLPIIIPDTVYTLPRELLMLANYLLLYPQACEFYLIKSLRIVLFLLLINYLMSNYLNPSRFKKKKYRDIPFYIREAINLIDLMFIYIYIYIIETLIQHFQSTMLLLFRSSNNRFPVHSLKDTLFLQ